MFSVASFCFIIILKNKSYLLKKSIFYHEINMHT
jgi:hypothetical protein